MPALSFEAFADARQPPPLAEIERRLGATATAVPRSDRHSEVVFPGGIRFLSLVPAAPDGRPRLDTGPMAALTFSSDKAQANCVETGRLAERLVASGWISAPKLSAERHSQNPGGSREPQVFSRHDHHLELQLFPAANGCLAGYALLWNMDLSMLAHLMPGIRL